VLVRLGQEVQEVPRRLGRAGLSKRSSLIYVFGMTGAVISAGRRALAAFVLLVAGLVVVWLAAFRVGHPEYLGPKVLPPAMASKLLSTPCAVGTDNCYATRPGWTIPAAVAIACLGLAVAAVLHRGRNWALRSSADDL
jgi:uncharacterized membrane protein